MILKESLQVAYTSTFCNHPRSSNEFFCQFRNLFAAFLSLGLLRFEISFNRPSADLSYNRLVYSFTDNNSKKIL